MHAPPEVHAQFDAICAEVSEWEPLPTRSLPTVSPKPVEPTEEHEPTEEERTAPLDGLILAGLVAP